LAEIEVWRGSVAAWECDAMGHLNVGFYVTRSMEGLAGLAAELGLGPVFAPRAEATLMVREQYIRFVREARPNAPLFMTAAVLSMDETDARILMTLRHAGGELAACFQTVVVHATARDGRVFAWSDRVRGRAEALGGGVPDGGAPRSISLEPVETQAGLARADALGLACTARGAVMPQHCDAFGRMRTEGFMHRLSDAVMPTPAGDGGTNPGRAALEYRLIHHAWPRAGDRLELRSGVGGGDNRVQRLFHWLLDPASGRPWATAQAISVALDLEARKIVTLSDAELAQARKTWIPELGL
jgi:acyl-CoA thioester hydrolase